jgi:hypothetical protein
MAEVPVQPQPTSKGINWKTIFIGAVIVGLVVGIGALGFYLYQSQTKEKTSTQVTTPKTATDSAKLATPSAEKTEIRVQGLNASVLIEPSVDNVISGVVTITVTKAPNGTKMAFFTIQGQGIKDTGPNLGIDNDGSDGWSRLLDTTEYKNGLYEISGLAMSGPDDNPLGVATAQVKIQN